MSGSKDGIYSTTVSMSLKIEEIKAETKKHR
jgi:hypothetical protein